ncbi:MAG: hypothetical protein HYX22_00630 [Candidatus Yanofskybacteria bacterium]|nr:hypothetical protein [Candidatus Yanofskybacteria bacterium]
MKARTVLSIVFVALFAVSASAQQYYQPAYTQRFLPEPLRAPIFVENETGGVLYIRFEVNGVVWPVRVLTGNFVPDLMVPVDSRMKVSWARALVLENNGTQEKKVKHCSYVSEARDGQQGWYFYQGKSVGPCEQ